MVFRPTVGPLPHPVGRWRRIGWISRLLWHCRAAAVLGLAAASLLYASLAIAAAPAVTAVAVTGSNTDLHIVISGSGFGTAPAGVPCKSCTTPFLEVTSGRGGCQLFNIATWSNSSIVFDGLQGEPGDSVLVRVTNPQSKVATVRGQITIPSSITLVNPHISAVRFQGSVGRNLIITVIGTGFGAAPSGLPFIGDVPWLAFVDRPFAAKVWVAGYGFDGVWLNYGSWTNTRILIAGFGGMYGQKNWTVHPHDDVEVAVANTSTCGLGMSVENGATVPTSVSAVWGGELP